MIPAREEEEGSTRGSGGRPRRRSRSPRYPEVMQAVDMDGAGEGLLRSSKAHRHKVTVFIRIVILKLGEIDTVKECFTADAFVQAKWRERAFDNNMQLKVDEIRWDDYWNPKLYVDNSQGDPKETIWRTVIFNSKQEAYIYERRRIKGTFLENMELNHFPFDTQDLTLTVLSEHTADAVELQDDARECSTINLESFVDAQEWQVYKTVETSKSVVDKVFEGSSNNHPCIASRVHASRRVGFYVFNIFFVLSFLACLAFASFAVEPTLPQNRLQMTFTLLLTNVTFKFAINNFLPKVSYLTCLDYYILASMGLLGVVAVWHALVGKMLKGEYTPTELGDMDKHALAVLASVFLLGQIAFWAFVYFHILRQRSIYNQSENAHQAEARTKIRTS